MLIFPHLSGLDQSAFGQTHVPAAPRKHRIPGTRVGDAKDLPLWQQHSSQAGVCSSLCQLQTLCSVTSSQCVTRSRGLVWGFPELSDDTTSTRIVTHSGASPSHTENKETDWNKMQYLYSPALSARTKIPYGPQLLLQITLQVTSIYLPTNYELQGFSTATVTWHFLTGFFSDFFLHTCALYFPGWTFQRSAEYLSGPMLQVLIIWYSVISIYFCMFKRIN